MDDDSSEEQDEARLLDVQQLVSHLQALVDKPAGAVRAVEAGAGAAWRRATKEETGVHVAIGVAFAIGLMLALPERVANRPRWVVPALAGLLLLGVFVAKSAVFA